MNKNDLKINIHTIPEVYRGDIFDVRFEVTSETTALLVNVIPISNIVFLIYHSQI